jgi:hypothetical protein
MYLFSFLGFSLEKPYFFVVMWLFIYSSERLFAPVVFVMGTFKQAEIVLISTSRGLIFDVGFSFGFMYLHIQRNPSGFLGRDWDAALNLRQSVTRRRRRRRYHVLEEETSLHVIALPFPMYVFHDTYLRLEGQL